MIGLLRENVRRVASIVRLAPFETETEAGRSLERYRRIFLTSISGLTVRAIGMVVTLVTVPLVLGHLGKERYGAWATITTFVSWMSLFDFGVANGLVNCLSRAHGRGDREEAGRFFSTALAALAGTAAVLAALFAAWAPFVPWESVLGVHGVLQPGTLRWAVIAAMGLFVASLPLSVVPQVYAAYQQSYVANAFTLLGSFVGLAATVAAIRLEASFPVLVLAIGVGPLVASAVGLTYASTRAMPWLKPARRHVSRDALAGLFARSVPIFFFQIGALLVNETQPIVLAHRCSLSVVGDYAIVKGTYLVLISTIQLGTNSFVPPFREANEQGDRAWVRTAFGRLLRIRIALATAAGLVGIAVGNDLLHIWLRRADVSFGPALWIAMLVLLVAAVVNTSYAELLQIMDRFRVLVAIVLVNGASTLLLTHLLAPKLQVVGAVVAMSAPSVFLIAITRRFALRVLAERGAPRSTG